MLIDEPFIQRHVKQTSHLTLNNPCDNSPAAETVVCHYSLHYKTRIPFYMSSVLTSPPPSAPPPPPPPPSPPPGVCEASKTALDCSTALTDCCIWDVASSRCWQNSVGATAVRCGKRPACTGRDTFNAGFGVCSTYRPCFDAETGPYVSPACPAANGSLHLHRSNSAFCVGDRAAQSCSECGECVDLCDRHGCSARLARAWLQYDGR